MNNFLQQINSYIKEAFNAGKYLYNGISVTLKLRWDVAHLQLQGSTITLVFRPQASKSGK